MYLIKSGEDIIHELDFSNSGVTHSGQSNSETCNALLCQRGIKHAFSS